MPLIRSVLLCTALAAAPLLAHADVITVFDLNSSYTGADGNGTLDGTITIDVTSGVLTDVSLTAAGFLYGNGAVTLTSSNDLEVFFDLPGTTLVGYTGSPICTTSYTSGCVAATAVTAKTENLTSTAVSGSLEPAPVPEPESLVLVSTALLGLAGGVRRRVGARAGRIDRTRG